MNTCAVHSGTQSKLTTQNQVPCRSGFFRVGDSPDLPLGIDDPDILQWAEQKGCIVVACDRQTMARYFRDHIDAGRHSLGLILLTSVFSIAHVPEYLILAAHASEPTEWHDRIVYYS